MKEDQTTEINRKYVSIAQERWCRFHKSNEKNFAKYLGVVMLNRISWKPGMMHLRRSAVEKIMALNSPHWYAMLKARQAQLSQPLDKKLKLRN